jgi:parallel beta-helix repeat protein
MEIEGSAAAKPSRSRSANKFNPSMPYKEDIMKNSLLRSLAFASLLILTSILFASVTPISTCGTVITTPGSYALSADLACSGDGVDIQANKVTLYLKGHTISGPGAYAGSTGVSVGGEVFKTVTILGPGTIANFSIAVAFDGTDGGGLIGVDMTGNATSLFVGNSVSLNPSTSLLIAQNTCNGTVGEGFNFPAIENSTIVGNNCTNNYFGILLAGSKNTFVGNTITNNYGDGIYISSGSGNVFRGNQLRSNGGNGINNYASGNQFIGNLATGNSSYDINENVSACAGDTYKNDAFVTANLPCVK